MFCNAIDNMVNGYINSSLLYKRGVKLKVKDGVFSLIFYFNSGVLNLLINRYILNYEKFINQSP